MNFKIGDVVRLKSGGPRMTVYEPRNDYGTVDVVWFNHEGTNFTQAHASFRPEMLELVTN